MRNRKPDIKVQRWVAMLQAADLIEREGRYKWMEVSVPGSCSDVGCALGWIGYCAKMEAGTNVDAVARWCGFAGGEEHFYDAMDSVQERFIDGETNWHAKPPIAATTLRKLAEEMTA